MSTLRLFITKSLTVRTAAVFALLLAIPAVALAQDYKPSKVKYDKRTIRSDYMAAPSNAIAVGRVMRGKPVISAQPDPPEEGDDPTPG